MKDGYTHIMLIVDRSGSMFNIRDDMNGAIVQMMEDQAKEPGTLLVDVITFDTAIDVVHDNVAPLDVKKDVIEPRGNTALNDAIGVGVTRLGNKIRLMKEEDRPEHVIVVVVTDGMENSSKDWTHDQVKALVLEQTERWNWTFMYLAANVDAFATGGSYGFAKGQTIAFASSGESVSNVYAGLHANASRARRGDTTGFTQDERDAAEAP
jgi:uncharacterized protein YegL